MTAGSDLFQDATQRRRLYQIVLFVIIIATLPCYVIGAVLLAVAPDNQDESEQNTPLPSLGATGLIVSPSPLPILAFTASPTISLQSTPGQFLTPRPTVILPSATTAPSLTVQPPTATQTSAPPTATFTSAPATATFTPEPPTSTETFTTEPPTSTFTPEPPTATFTETFTPTVDPGTTGP